MNTKNNHYKENTLSIGLATDINFTNNDYLSHSVDTHIFDNFRLSVLSTVAITIELRFHHPRSRDLFNVDVYTIPANSYRFFSNLVLGEKCYLKITKPSGNLATTDNLGINMYFNTNSGHLITTTP